MCNIYTKVLRTRLLRKYDNFYRCIVYFFYNFFLVKSIIAELLWKNTLVGAALEDQYVKSEVYKPNCKSVCKLNLQKKHFCYVNESGKTNHRYRLLLTTKFSGLIGHAFCQIYPSRHLHVQS